MKDKLKALLSNPACDYLEIRVEDTSRTDFRFQGPRLEELNERRSGGAAIRALVKGCWGFVTLDDLSQLEEGVNRAIQGAEAAALVAPGASTMAPVDATEASFTISPLNDPRDVPLEEKINLFKGYNDRVLAREGVTSSLAYYFDEYTKRTFANSEGSYIEREILDMACAIAAICTRDGDTRTGRVSQGSTNDFNVFRGLEAEVDHAVDEALAKLDAPVISSGTYTVVCDPHLAGVFVHEAFGHLSEGDNIADDKAMQEVLTIGRTFGEDFLTIYDSGLDDGKRGFIPVDDEGVPTEKTMLIENGKLVGRLHSRETAGKLGEKPTGSARAISYRHPPIPRMRNTCIAPGPHGSLEDMIKDVELGVYAVDASGGQTNGEVFTFTAGDAFMIRNGKLAERVKDVTIGGNVFETLANIDRIGSEFGNRDSAGGCGKAGQMPLPVSHGSPHIRIKDCVIGGQ